MQVIEITHDKVLAIMNAHDQAKKKNDIMYAGFCVGLATCCDLLGIRIDGVNWFDVEDDAE